MQTVARRLSARLPPSHTHPRRTKSYREEASSSQEVPPLLISYKILDRSLDNSDRRQYGLGVVGRLFHRRLRRERITPDVRQQLDDLYDHRPFFTYWVTTVQILVTIVSLAVYGFGPVGFHMSRKSGLVLVTSLSLQEVDYFEPDNFWIGPRAEMISTWKKWDISRPGPPRWVPDTRGGVAGSSGGERRRLSGSVCGQDPRHCQEPASVGAFEWPDDITRWPVCRQPTSQPTDQPHMACEVIGRPCCVGIYGDCRITTKEYCDFVHGFFHEEAALCSQVS
ncbi:rom-4 [Cordylochernes scorpioides]|uniref:Rom-4 n=1 Tax=Cordylochernes scorpioides TaxID=51811 RepID=A0ABY6LNW2_9ARAC|nr:rom-4 [Cordylochernes scorpioides]